MAVIACPICSTRYRVADSQLSKVSRLKCKKCKTVFPLTENVKTEESSTGDTQPLSPLEETGTSQQQFGGAETQTLQRQPDPSTGPGLDDMSLDSEVPPESSSPGLDFSFDTKIPEDEGIGKEAKIRDHIMDTSQKDEGQIEVGLGDLSLVGDESDSESTLSMEQGLDFSFSANIPETEPEEGEEGIPEESEGVPEASGPGLFQEDLSLGDVPGEQTLTLTGKPSTGHLEEQQGGFQQPVIEEPFEDEGIPQEEGEPLSTCCIDSLAMGLKTCEICGRNLEGREHEVGAELEQQRRQQLKEELLQGKVQIEFSGEPIGDETTTLQQAEEDFTDVEQALDALADGTFEKTIKKKEARKAAAKKMKMIGAAIVVVLVLVAGVIWTLRPKPEETLMRRYRELISQPEMDPQKLAVLFLDAVSEQAQEVFKLVSVMEKMPSITGGSIESVGEEYEETSLGSPGKDLAQLHEEIKNLKTEIEEKNQEWQEVTEKKNLTLKLIGTQINTLTTKQESLQAEFDEKEAESAAKLVKLKQQLEDAEQELEENKRRAAKYMDATDELGKATYKAADRKVKQLITEIIPDLKKRINQEESAHRKRMEELDVEYAPRFSEVQAELQTQQALYEEVKLLQDPKNSPLAALAKKLKELKKTIDEKEDLIKEKENQLETAKAFFKRKGQRERIEKDQHIAEFSHVSRNIVASVKLGGSKQKVPLVLKRYRAIIADQTIQGDWVVEKILK